MAYMKGIVDTHGNFIAVVSRVLVMPKTPRRAESAEPGKGQVIEFARLCRIARAIGDGSTENFHPSQV